VSKTRTKSSAKRERRGDPLFERALAALAQGGLVVYPTETFYGLGANALDPDAVKRVVALKGRDPGNPIPLILADREMLADIVTDVPETAAKLIELFWPGPLTLVLPGRKDLPAPLLNPSGGVGLRVSSHPVATRLARELGGPITATSANPSREAPARAYAEALRYFSGVVDVILDGGALAGTRGSTVVEAAGDRLKIIREGEISAARLRQVVPVASA
jgi:L-threonylcarbamoyladenylate synthase